MHKADVQRARKSNPGLDGDAIARMEAEVRATYVEHDETLSNPDSRRRFALEAPRLDADQQEILNTLRADGLAMMPVTKLFSPSVWAELAAHAAAFQHGVETELGTAGREAKHPKGDAGGRMKKKFFFRRAVARGETLSSGNPWLRFAASRRMLDIVNTYRGLWTKIGYLDCIYTIPGGEEAEYDGWRWHRDFDERDLVRVFLYVSEIDQRSGVMEYIAGSAPGGPYANDWPWDSFGQVFPDPVELEHRIPRDAVRAMTGAAGTLVFCNTSGFHRGWFAPEKPRLMGVVNYVSPAALHAFFQRNYTVDLSRLPADSGEPARFALS